MKLSLIVAIDKNYGIGKDNDLMWHLPEDIKFFKETTLNNVVIMGRKNFESIPEKYRPLPNRENVVLTRQKDWFAKGCLTFFDLKTCLEHYKDDTREIFIIGGGELYKQTIDLVDTMYITCVDEDFDADVFFPQFSLDVWDTKIIKTYHIDDKHKHMFSIIKYSKKLLS